MVWRKKIQLMLNYYTINFYSNLTVMKMCSNSFGLGSMGFVPYFIKEQVLFGIEAVWTCNSVSGLGSHRVFWVWFRFKVYFRSEINWSILLKLVFMVFGNWVHMVWCTVLVQRFNLEQFWCSVLWKIVLVQMTMHAFWLKEIGYGLKGMLPWEI